MFVLTLLEELFMIRNSLIFHFYVIYDTTEEFSIMFSIWQLHVECRVIQYGDFKVPLTVLTLAWQYRD